MAALLIRRVSTFWQDRLRAYTVLVDGKESGKIEQGSELRVPVGAGKHMVRLKIDWCSSPELETAVEEGQTQVIECGPSANPLTSLLFVIFRRDRYLWLRSPDEGS